MVNKELRKALARMCEEEGLSEEEQPLILDNMSYDNSIIGLTVDRRLVYSYEKMVEELMKDEGWSYEEAVEWLEYNTLRAIPYMSSAGLTPIILEDGVESIIEKYGDSAWQGLFSGNSRGVKVDIVYEPSINEFRGNRSVQIIIENFK